MLSPVAALVPVAHTLRRHTIVASTEAPVVTTEAPVNTKPKVKKIKGSKDGLPGIAMKRSYVINRLDRATKDNFMSTVYCPEVEEYVRSKGKVAFPNLQKRIANKAKALGIAVKPDFAKQKWSGPALWLKGQAAEAIKTAMAAKNVAAIEAAVAATATLQGVQFVKIKNDAKGKPLKVQPVTACSALIADAKALVETIKKEEAAAAATAAAAAAPVAA
jgi:hypothetical protein